MTLYVVDTSFFPSIGAVNPSVTAIAMALRVADHLAERLHWPRGGDDYRNGATTLMATDPVHALVIFGATGDLAKLETFPALVWLVERGVLDVPVAGVAKVDGGSNSSATTPLPLCGSTRWIRAPRQPSGC